MGKRLTASHATQLCCVACSVARQKPMEIGVAMSIPLQVQRVSDDLIKGFMSEASRGFASVTRARHPKVGYLVPGVVPMRHIDTDQNVISATNVYVGEYWLRISSHFGYKCFGMRWDDQTYGILLEGFSYARTYREASYQADLRGQAHVWDIKAGLMVPALVHRF